MLQKFLITAAIILAVWYGFKWVGRLQKKRREDAQRQVRGDGGGRPDGDTEDMIACPTCGDYLAAGTTVNCGRDACPYPG
jgi:hypothetical protein